MGLMSDLVTKSVTLFLFWPIQSASRPLCFLWRMQILNDSECCRATPLLPVETCVLHKAPCLWSGPHSSSIHGPACRGFLPSLPGPPVPARCIVDANVHPMTHPNAVAEAICWNDAGRILAVGDRDRVLATANEAGIEPESLPGHTVIPGFVDAHMHFLHVGVRLIRPDLRGAPSLAAALDQFAAWLRDHPGDDPVIAEGWDESDWPEVRFPTKDELDGLSKERALVMRRQCGHFAVANSLALPAIRSNWDDPDLVDLDAGILKEQPSLYLNEVMPVPPSALDDALQMATDIAHRLGVTCVGEYTQAPFRDALLRSADNGTLRIRIANHIYVQQLDDAVDAGFGTGTPRGLRYHAGGISESAPHAATDSSSPDAVDAVERLRDGGLKVFHDGSFGGRTALLRQPYLDDPDDDHNRGVAVWTDDEVDRWYQDAHRAGIQVTAHAIGDAAIDQGLDGYERLRARCTDAPQEAGSSIEHGAESSTRKDASKASSEDSLPAWQDNALRHRFEHYELPHDDAVKRTVDLGIVACAQPNFLGEWSAKGGMYERRLGPVFRLNNRYRTFLDAGMHLCFGSDGMPFGPLYGIQAAVDHPFEDERLTPAEAVWLYTDRAAWACHWDDVTGSLMDGKRADVLVLDVADLDAKPPHAWVIRETILDGATVARNSVPTPSTEALETKSAESSQSASEISTEA